MGNIAPPAHFRLINRFQNVFPSDQHHNHPTRSHPLRRRLSVLFSFLQRRPRNGPSLHCLKKSSSQEVTRPGNTQGHTHTRPSPGTQHKQNKEIKSPFVRNVIPASLDLSTSFPTHILNSILRRSRSSRVRIWKTL